MQNGDKSLPNQFETIVKSVVENLQDKILEVLDKDHPGFRDRMKEVEDETIPIIHAIDELLVAKKWKATEVHILYLIQAMLSPLSSHSEMIQKIRLQVLETLHHYLKHLSHDSEDADRWINRANLPTLGQQRQSDS